MTQNFTSKTISGIPYGYIGVTDFTSIDQVNECLEHLPDEIFSLGYKLHVGVMCSFSTINDIPTKMNWKSVWPSTEQIEKIFQPNDKVLNVLHYADYSSPCRTTAQIIDKVISHGSKNMQALQLDMPWPSEELLTHLKTNYPDLLVITQVSHKALEMCPNREDLHKKLLHLQGLTNWALIDYGMGRAQPIDVPHAHDILSVAREIFPPSRLTIAGGLGPDTLEAINPLMSRWGLMSIDAQGQMRESKNALDPIQMPRVIKYLSKASSAILDISLKNTLKLHSMS